MCLYSKIMKNPKYKKNKKNGGDIPPCLDERVKYVPIGCGRCIECRKQYGREWAVRLQEDIKVNTNGKFVTLTFSDESIAELNEEKIIEFRDDKELRKEIKIADLQGYEKDNAIATLAVRRFTERWRKTYGKAPRHWLITELGHNGTENIHLHGIIWTDTTGNEIRDHWKYGYVWDGKVHEGSGRKENYVNAKTVNYIIKYVTKMDMQHKAYKSRVLASKGIGKNYMDRSDWKKNVYKEGETDERYRVPNGAKVALPKYYRNKIYTEEEREKLWVEKIDKGERWILGQKVTNDKDYFELLKHAQEQNRKLGYGTDHKDWNREVYERETRILKQKIRIERGNSASKSKGVT